ncbi:MAG: YncE family protein [Bacteroidales bacterium]
MKKTKLLFYLILGTFAFVACNDDDNDGPAGLYSNGAFILHEGNFGRSNATVGFLSFTTDSFKEDIFSATNNRPLGDVLQSMTIYQGKGYLVVNNSNKIEVVNIADFKQAGVVENLSSPRFVTFYQNKGYVTQWGDGFNGSLAIFDIAKLAVDTVIAIGSGPEGIAEINQKLWIANGGGWGTDSTLVVFDPATLKIEKRIVVGYNPQHFVVDQQGYLWVLCSGAADWNNSENDKPSSLVKVDVKSYTVVATVTIGKNDHPAAIACNKDKNVIYYGAGYGFNGIWKVGINATTTETAPFIEGYFYGFSVNSTNGEIYAFDAKDYASKGEMIRYSTTGSKIKSYTVGIIPKAAVFN